ncbi:sugar ABC transporter substrate-binding protein [Enterococcus pseudoavium]|uniref:Sugar ABC transporter substrate-binding protein n=1 Tax=Enterococcus pseudoavium TaxID=44007 RepID=A0ABU3FJG1_9ENTE|nr:sugar ABC transporter substrate-binding protein [Enterococcus pseudoavium]MDT2753988.1 sugar ABC transporter substrate-binding protein [Enterococcus pseudoavium]MDT2771201.1 sugar ABC transporter substrate-binding protein [Enterococcus pseudoavium]
MKRHWSIKVSAAILIFISVIGIYSLGYKNPSRQNRVFGVSFMTMNNPFYEVINNELWKVIENSGDALITLDPVLDIKKQNEQIQYFIDKKVDGIFINPIDSEAVKPALEKAKKAGIPIIAVDAPVKNSELVNVTVVSDNYDAGVQCAKDMMARFEQAKIILLKHTATKSAKDRIDGFLATIKGHEQYQVVNQGECQGQLEKAMPLMEEMLKKTPDVDVVMALNDPSALGAIAALEEVERPEVKVYGVDGTPELKSLITSSSNVVGTVAQSPISMGRIAADEMYQLLKGNGRSEVVVKVKLITSKNVEDYDGNGWQ